MLPDFPKIKKKYAAMMIEYLDSRIRQDPLLGGIKEERHYEGNISSIDTDDGEIEKKPYELLSSRFVVSREDIINKGPEAYVGELNRMADEISRQQSEFLFKVLTETTERTGNVVDQKGQPFTHDIYLKALEKTQIEFDEFGNPSIPTLIGGPELVERVNKMIPEWIADPEFQKQMGELIEQKKREWNDRESNRKLVD